MKENSKLYTLLAKELGLELKPEERDLLLSILDKDEVLLKDFQAIRSFWYQFHPKPFSHNIVRTTEKRLGIQNQKRIIKKKLILYQIAAGLLLLISLGLFYLSQQAPPETTILSEYHSFDNEVKQIELTDGTKIWLNSGSSLLTMQPFKGETRNVKLFGEAYFEVEPDIQFPFTVETRNLTIKVLGTTFNVSSYPDYNEQIIELYDGKIKLETTDNSLREVFLSPGQRAKYSPEVKNFQISAHGKDDAAAWRDGVLVFYNDNLEYIAKQLERIFNTQIFFLDKGVANLRFTAEFTDEPLNKIFLLLNDAKKFNYTVSEQGVLISSLK